MLSLCCPVGIVTSTMTGLLGQSRLLVVLGRERLLPASLAAVSQRTGTPIWATALTGGMAAALALVLDIGILAELVSIGEGTVLSSAGGGRVGSAVWAHGLLCWCGHWARAPWQRWPALAVTLLVLGQCGKQLGQPLHMPTHRATPAFAASPAAPSSQAPSTSSCPCARGSSTCGCTSRAAGPAPCRCWRSSCAYSSSQ